MPLAKPNKALSPTWGKSVGGVGERAGAKAGGSNLSAFISFACRGGKRHPGFLEGSSLRGALSERRPWSARFRLVRLPPHYPHAPVTADVRRSPRRGTPSVYAIQGVGAGRRHGTPLHADRDASFARSFDPCSSILTTQRSGKTGRWWGVLGGIAAGQTRVTGTNQHRGHQGGQSAARRASLLERAAWCVRKGRWSRPSSLRGKESPGLVARTSK